MTPAAWTNSWLNSGITPRAVGTEAVGVDRYVAPAEDGQALLVGEVLDLLAGLRDLVRVAVEERRADGVRARPAAASKSTTSRRNASGTWSRMPGAVTGVDLGARGAAVVEVAERGERLDDDVVAGPRRSGWPRRRPRRRRARSAGRRALGGRPACSARIYRCSRRRRPSRGRSGEGVQGTALAQARSG